MSTATEAPASPERMLRADRHYREALGLSTVPIAPEAKKPHPELSGWQARPLSDELVGRYVRQGCGLGAVHGWSGTGTLDLDTRKELAAVALGAVGVDLDALLSAPGPMTVGNPAKPPKPWYRTPDGYNLTRRVLNWPKQGDPTSRVVVLELRAGAVQDVLPPTGHPDTGKPYRWTDVPRRREDLPLVPGPLLGLWLAWDLLRPRMEAACPWAAPETEPTPAPRWSRPYDGPSVVEAWNKRVPAGAVLNRNGYKRAGDGRWVCPDSTTGDPGVVLLDDGRVFSHHGSDPLGGPHSHDSFGLLTVLEHAGDPKEAARAAARELGMEENSPRRAPLAVAEGAR